MRYFTKQDVDKLQATALEIRKDIVSMICTAQAGHPGSSLSAVEIVTALYFHLMRIDPKNPRWEDRDRFVMSKGHGCPALYAALCRRGFFDPSHLKTLRKYHSILQGHPDMRKTPGVDMTSGSLGNGMSTALGMALAGNAKKKDYTVYVMLGDGELQEGIIWEAAMTAAHYRLPNLVAIVDHNGLQINGLVDDVLSLHPLPEKFRAFGWEVIEADGHDFTSLLQALYRAKKACHPVVIIAHTIKGKGVSFMENEADWHGKAPCKEEAEQALAELSQGGAE